METDGLCYLGTEQYSNSWAYYDIVYAITNKLN